MFETALLMYLQGLIGSPALAWNSWIRYVVSSEILSWKLVFPMPSWRNWFRVNRRWCCQSFPDDKRTPNWKEKMKRVINLCLLYQIEIPLLCPIRVLDLKYVKFTTCLDSTNSTLHGFLWKSGDIGTDFYLTLFFIFKNPRSTNQHNQPKKWDKNYKIWSKFQPNVDSSLFCLFVFLFCRFWSLKLLRRIQLDWPFSTRTVRKYRVGQCQALYNLMQMNMYSVLSPCYRNCVKMKEGILLLPPNWKKT